MTSVSTSTPAGLRDDLLKEIHLWAIFWESLRIPWSKTNIMVGLVFCAGTILLTIGAAKASDVANQLYSMGTIALSSTVSLLGFLIAGFSFFATVSDKQMFCRMAEYPHKKSGLSYLKYNLFIFMRVFAQYLLVCIGSLAVILIFQPNSVARQSVRSRTSRLTWPLWLHVPWRLDVTILSLMLGVSVGLFVYLLMELGSFIFNVYHVVMTTIKWEMEKEKAPQSGGP